MLKKTIKYVDYDGHDQVGVFYFHLNESELTELKYSKEGGLEAYYNKIVSDKDGLGIMSAFKELIRVSYGERSSDNQRFIKDKDASDAFMQSAAYEELFMELVTDAKAGAEFFNGIVPAQFMERIARGQANLPEVAEPSFNDLVRMSDADFEKIAGNNIREMSKEHLMAAMARKNGALN